MKALQRAGLRNGLPEERRHEWQGGGGRSPQWRGPQGQSPQRRQRRPGVSKLVASCGRLLASGRVTGVKQRPKSVALAPLSTPGRPCSLRLLPGPRPALPRVARSRPRHALHAPSLASRCSPAARAALAVA